jgi:hypothetical protein
MPDPAPGAEPLSTTTGCGRFLAWLGVTFVGGLALAWTWVALAPLAFLDPEYPYWRAKQVMLQRCDLGSVVVLGDSRAAVDIVPARLGVPVANLAVGGGEAVEAQAALKRALACPVPPQRVVMSFDPVHFARPDLFWERTVRFGFVDLAELRSLRRKGERLGDASFAAPHAPDGLPGRLRDLLYAARFPSLYGASLAKGGIALRWPANWRALQDGLTARGQYFFGTAAGSDVVAADATLPAFTVLPVLDAYFDAMLDALSARGIPVDFMAMPLNQATAHAVSPRMMAGFAAYLARAAQRHGNFHVVGPLLVAWPNRLFGDAYGHLNPAGAALFSDWLGACLSARMRGADRCEPMAAAALLAERGE